MPRLGYSLQKALAATGSWSRRESAGLVLKGRVQLNGKLCNKPAERVLAEDTILVDGNELASSTEEPRLWRFHKPPGFITTHSDPQGRPTVFDSLPETLPRVVSVGRLDLPSEGLLLLTNSGKISRLLELPASGYVRRYSALLATGKRSVTPEIVDEISSGLTLEDGTVFRPMQVEVHERHAKGCCWVDMQLTEGHTRHL